MTQFRDVSVGKVYKPGVWGMGTILYYGHGTYPCAKPQSVQHGGETIL